MNSEFKILSSITFARSALGLSPSVPIDIEPLGGRGSDRAYYRVRWLDGNSAMLVHYDPRRIENAYFAGIAAFLGDIGVPVPHIIGDDPEACLILMEDLGAEDLWTLRGSPWDVRRDLYEKALVAVHRLHSFPIDGLDRERVRLMEGFGPEMYRWERAYFMEHIVQNLCRIGLRAGFKRALETELSTLAERLQTTTQCLIHRDLQSQNVMVRKGRPVLIDFQGVRVGSPFYDLGSFLMDPYVAFSHAEREHFLSFYYGLGRSDLDETTFCDLFWDASSQRLMQALGAYGFLGIKKGLTAYLSHIPAAVANLRLAAGQTKRLPLLSELLENPAIVCR